MDPGLELEMSTKDNADKKGSRNTAAYSTNRRRVFRLRLPEDSMLRVKIGEQEYEVLEVAELSLLLSTVSVSDVSGKFQGSIEWSDSKSLEFTGEIGPTYDGERLVIWKVQGITMEDVISEQRRLLRKYPLLHESQDQRSAG